jgi:hypothetical protein
MQNTFCIDAELLSTTLDMLFAKHSVAVISGTSHAHGDYWCGLCAWQAERLRVRCASRYVWYPETHGKISAGSVQDTSEPDVGDASRVT